jgi:hypothetical protein
MPTVPPHATPMAVSTEPIGTQVVEPPARPEPAPMPTLERYEPRDLVGPIGPIVRRAREEVILERRYKKIEPIDVAEIDFLPRCARDFVQTQVAPARRVLVDAFTHYQTSCDADGKVVLERPLGFDSRDRRTRSDVGLAGTIAPRGAGIVLRVASCGAETAYDRVTIIAAGASWTSSRLEVRRDGYGCDIAELPYTRALAKMLELAIDPGPAAVVRFDGAGIELAVTDAIRDELRRVLDAVDAITAP